MQLVVVMAVRKAVSAATTTFTAISMTHFFITIHFSLFTSFSSVRISHVVSVTHGNWHQCAMLSMMTQRLRVGEHFCVLILKNNLEKL